MIKYRNLCQFVPDDLKKKKLKKKRYFSFFFVYLFNLIYYRHCFRLTLIESSMKNFYRTLRQ